MGIKGTFAVAIIACVLFTTLFIVIRSKGANAFSIIAKAFASFCFIACFMLSLSYVTDFNDGYIGIALGLVLGLIGDVLLDGKVAYKESGNEYLQGGFVSFGVGHFFYIFALLTFATTMYNVGSLLVPLLITGGVAIVLTVATYFMTKFVMKLDFGKNIIITFAYTFILYFVTVLAVVLSFYNIGFVSLAVGLVLFTLSDLVLSMQYFGDKGDSNVCQIINHTLYYLGQIVIASTIFIQLLF